MADAGQHVLMSGAPGGAEGFADHLRRHGYHPRSNAHSNAVCETILQDLVLRCQRIRDDFANGRLVYDHNIKVIVGTNDANIDLVIGVPPASFVRPTVGGDVIRQRPSTFRIVIEAKAIMTEHAKARRNRQRDLDSFHQFVHRLDSAIVAAAFTVVNVAEQFRSPLRPAGEITKHRNVTRLVEETVAKLRMLPVRSGDLAAPGLEANGALVIAHDNIDLSRTRLVSEPPAPQVGDPLHYDAFIQQICDHYSRRWVP